MWLKLESGQFPNLNFDWFKEHAARDPKIAFEAYKDWIKKRTGKKKLDPHREEDHKVFLRYVLIAATSLCRTTVRYYIKGEDDPENVQRTLSVRTIRNLDHVTHALGCKLPKWTRRPQAHGIPGIQIAILSELEPLIVPSFSYHMRVIHAIVHSDSAHLFLTALHEVKKSELDGHIRKLLRVFSPDVFVLIRLTPSKDSLEFLQKEKIPLFLVHADHHTGRYYTSPPVLANIVPDHRPMVQDLKNWIENHPRLKDLRKKGIVVVSMPKENKLGSIRDDRIKSITEALESLGLRYKHILVDGYSFDYAYAAYKSEATAPLFICLSDQLAVGIKHVIMASGGSCEHRVIGFDHSELAQREKIPSFDQGIEEIGQEISDKLEHFFSLKPQSDDEWPRFVEKKVAVRLMRA